MLERIKNVLGGRRREPAPLEPLHGWARGRSLTFTDVSPGQLSLYGQLDGRAFRAECGPSSRSFIHGIELRARHGLGFRLPGAVVIMNRALKRQLEVQANALYSDYIDDLQTSALELPEEIRWLSLYRDMGWSGPEDAFWAAFAVMTDAPELARHWLTEDMIGALMRTLPHRPADTPFLLMLMRGNTYLRMQVNPADDQTSLVGALELVERSSKRARTAPSP